ncbi:hypothetical protein F1728_30940 [Gimesia benthica]|uniref:Uncharacterized protein n=1 Tax=Gimesia benthica TaxID=2608982 RepID=A0A6I6ANV9_9PLAN|nr:hypothetical protein [Gimesia benthica]QGQ26821.1 hypothetical protein F1728_30940 [Gimesia benthica]
MDIKLMCGAGAALLFNLLTVSTQADEPTLFDSPDIELVSASAEPAELQLSGAETEVGVTPDAVFTAYEAMPEAAPCQTCQSDCGCQQFCQCDSCQACTLCDRIPLLNRFPSDPCFKHWIMPVSNPVWSIDPRSLTYVRGVFVNQMIDSQTPVLGAGDLQVYALQLGIALNERLSIIAVKDGFNTLQTRGVGNAHGWADIAAGVKYVLIRDVDNQFLLSTGMIYEAHNGSTRVFQGNGQGIWNPFLTGGKELCNGGHFIANAGFHLPADDFDNSTSFWYSLHYDHPLTEKLSALAEMNGIVCTKSGGALPVNFEGGDWINLGSSNVAGNDVITMAFGADYKINECLSFAGVWEFPVTERKDLLDSRTTVTLTLTF